MTVIGFQFNKMLAERHSTAKGKISIQNNVTVTSVETMPMVIKSEKQASAKVLFEFNSKYDPGVGVIELKGEVVWLDTKEKIQAMVAEWKKSKKLDKGVATPILNTIMSRANIEALFLSRDVNFPPPLQLPKVK